MNEKLSQLPLSIEDPIRKNDIFAQDKYVHVWMYGFGVYPTDAWVMNLVEVDLSY